MTPPINIMLETTIQLHRIVDAPAIRQRINAELRDKNVFTSSFVLREFIRTVIRDLAYVHRAVQQVGEQKDGWVALSKLAFFLAHGDFNYSPRSARREQYVIAAILACFDRTSAPLDKLLVFLEMTAQQWLFDFFEIQLEDHSCIRIDAERCFTDLDDSPDEMKRWLEVGLPIPAPPLFPAGAARFLQGKATQVFLVEQAVTTARARVKDTKLLAVLSKLKSESGEYAFVKKLTPRTRGNWALGDLLIALQAPRGASIYSSDKHFDVICPALGLRRYTGFLPRPPHTIEQDPDLPISR